MTQLTGSISDSSIMQRFSWYEPVLFNANKTAFPSDTCKIRGRFVGFAETVGHSMTYKILSDDNNKIFHRSEVRSALDPEAPNLRADLCDGEADTPLIIKSIKDERGDTVPQTQLEIIDPVNSLDARSLRNPRKTASAFGQGLFAPSTTAIESLQQTPDASSPCAQ
jgi:hypothetical protein